MSAPLPGHAVWCDWPHEHPGIPCPTPQPVCACGHAKDYHEDFREKASQPCIKRSCGCQGFRGGS
jgi:hypothetical protein